MLFFSFGLVMLATVAAAEIPFHDGAYHVLFRIHKCLVMYLPTLLLFTEK